MIDPLLLDNVDINTVSQFINRDHKEFYSNYSIDKNWVYKIGPEYFNNSLIIKINNTNLTYEKDFKLEKNYFILEIRSDLIPFKHLNAIIIDNNKIYRFEPYGSLRDIEKLYNYKIVDEFLKQFFKEYEYIGPMSYQITLGPQSLEELVEDKYEGFCSAWSLMFIHLKLLNKDKSIEEIDKMISSSNFNHKSKIFAYYLFIRLVTRNH